ncbi:baculoviral IAP repeat-containing protein 7-like [Anneissia japonica]|uniref:baculoviral IAP repeat-containing protein 7-like n=1 Tax=Anneissia japonica TaxID=1529436 RepID=UPI001425A1E0|nr:baculoviral IAP repeat-containing protein 7-like [Anneissia japonica]XP_033118159.1 baculoviral IAP repeat-containing protein 7-like [Anneissia japonica]
MTAENSHSKVRSLLSYAQSLDEHDIEADCVGFQRSHSLSGVQGTDLFDGVDDVDAGLTSLHSVDGIAVITSGATASVSNPCPNEGKNRHHGTERNLSSEVDRLATFKKWPHSSPMNPSTLARAGFFYTGSDDMVKCFSCNGKIKDWEFGDSAVGEHKRFFPKCKFIQGKDHQNQPMLQNKASSLQTVPVAKGQSSKEDDIFNPKKDALTIDKTKIPDKLKSEYRRLLTFQNWPRTNPMQPRALAKAGFYYTQTRDIVKCFACTGEISNWKVMDVPMTQHTMLFPECPFVQGEDVGNEKLTTTDVMNAQHAVVYREPSTKLPPTKTESKNKSQVSQTAKVTDQWASLQSQSARRPLTRAQHPQFGNEAERLKTFTYWPSSAPEAPPLAKAGFFHTGENDNVKCFYCNGGLRNWEPCDDPWTEHAKWFPKCDWLLQQRGEPFVQYVIANFPVPNQNLPLQPPAPPIPSPGFDTVQGTARPSVNLDAQPPPSATNQTDIQKRMDSRIVNFVVEMGFPQRKIKRIIERQLSRKEDEFNTIQSLVDSVLAEPDEPEDYEEEEPVENATGSSDLKSKKTEDDDEESKAAAKTKMLESSNTMNEKFANLNVGGATPQPKSSATSTLEDEASLPASIQDELRVLRDKRTCKICMDNEINVLFTPCGHLVACEQCARSIQICPICRMPIKTCIKTYLS